MQATPLRRSTLIRGFTLVEAMATLAIAVILASVLVPSFQGFIESRRIDSAAIQLAADVQFARSEAVARNQAVRMSFHADTQGTCYVLHTGAPADCPCTAATTAPAACGTPDARQIKTMRWPAAGSIRIGSNVTSLLFDPLHGTSTPAGTLLVSGPGGRAVHQVVNIMGRLRSCSPQVSMPGYPPC